MALPRQFQGFVRVNGNLVSKWTAVELSNPQAEEQDRHYHPTPYHTSGEFKLRWENATTRYLVHEEHRIYHLHSGGNYHVWNATYHPLPPPAYSIPAIANAQAPEALQLAEFRRHFGFRSVNEMYQDLGAPDALVRYGRTLMDILYQLLDRLQGVMAEMRNREELRRGD